MKNQEILDARNLCVQEIARVEGVQGGSSEEWHFPDKLDETVQPREVVTHEDRFQSVVYEVCRRGSNGVRAGFLTSFLAQHTSELWLLLSFFMPGSRG